MHWNSDGMVAAHMDHIFIGLQDYKSSFILNFYLFLRVRGIEHWSTLPKDVV